MDAQLAGDGELPFDDDAAERPPSDAGQPPPPDAGPCSPGEYLRPCAICGPDGDAVMPEEDPTCPAVDCTALDFYQVGERAGAPVCEKWVHPERPRVCLGLDTCASVATNTLCPAPRPIQTLRVEGACKGIAGCEGDTMGTASNAPLGTPCEDGICRADGTCDQEAFDACSRYEGVGICGLRVQPATGRYGCVLDVNTAGGTCLNFCQQAGTHCQAAWANPEGGCIRGDELGCIAAAPRQLCQCAQLN